MTATTEDPVVDRPGRAPAGQLPLAGIASIGAGLVHAAALGAHDEHRQVVVTFVVAALFQVGWGVLAMAAREPSTRRAVAAVGVFGNAALVVGFLIAKTSGIGFIDGLETAEPVGLADGMAAALAAIAAVLGFVALLRPSERQPHRGAWTVGVGVVAATALTVPAMVAAAAPHHHGSESSSLESAAAGHDGHDAANEGHDTADGHDAAGSTAGDARNADEGHKAAVARPFDPTKPIDLGGVPGVTPAQQAAAENLLGATLVMLPRWADPAVAEAAGFRSIGDGGTGHEHYINAAFMSDGRELDPSAPESLVYSTFGPTKELVAAMYIAEPGATLDTVPVFGGALTQWHIHDNLCFTADAKVAGLTLPDGTCAPPLVKTGAIPMIHVWITPNPCGPFASLEGIGAGKVKAGETRACDSAHGGH